MAFPAAPTESGGAKLHFLTTDGNAAAGWFGVDTGATGTGSNTVGFAAVATHVHDDAAGAPGGLATTSVPLVLGGGVRDDALGGLSAAAGDAVYLLVDANGALWTHDDALDAALSGSELQVDVVGSLPAGSNAIGKLAANTGVDIGDVDVTSVVPGTAATNLGKAEDAAHSSGDVGVMAMSVRQNTAAALSGTDADYQPLITDTNGRLHVLDANSAAIKTAVELIDNAVDGSYLNVNANIAGTDFVGGAGAVAAGVQRVTLASDDPAVAVLGTIDADTGAIKTAVELIDNAISGSEMQVDVVAALPAGSNAIGKLAANTGVDIGDVDVTSVVPGTGATNLGKAIDSAAGATDTGIAPVAIRDDSLSALTPAEGDWTPLRVNSTGALHVTGGGGGTQYAVDDALGATPTGTVAIAIRDDALAALTPVEGDAVGLRVDANGALWTRDDVLEAALSGSELQVDVVAALPAGANAIGKLAANTGVDIGDVDVTSVVAGVGATNLGKAEDAQHASGDVGVMSLAVRNDTLAALGGTDGDYVPIQVDARGALYMTGGIAHDAADSGNPIKLGGRAQDIIGAEPEEISADNDRIDALFDMNGRLGVTAGSDYKYADINDATSGDNSIVAAAGAGKRIAVWAILVVSDGTTDVRWEDGAGATAFTGQVPLQAREGYSISAGGLVPLFVGSANTALNLELTAAINVHGFVSYTVVED